MSLSYPEARMRIVPLRLMARAASGFAGLALLAVAPHALAQQWVLEPRVEVGAIYDDNYRMTNTPGQEIEVTGAGVEALLRARRATATSSFEITPEIHSTFFPDESSEESTDYFLAMSGDTRTLRTRSSLNFNFADETVVTSELPAADAPGVGLGQPSSGDAGRVSARNRLRLFQLQPSFTYDWTERRHLTLDAHYVHADYQADLFEQVGYADYGATAAMAFDVSQRSTLSVGVQAAQYDPNDSSPNTDVTGALAEWRMHPSQLMEVYFRAAATHVDRNATGSNGKLSATGFNGGAGVSWNFQVTQILVDLLRTTSPSSVGAVLYRNEARFRVNHSFDPRFTGYLALRGIRTEDIKGNATGSGDRKYATASTGFEWRFKREFSFTGSYDYTWQKFSGEPDDAVSNGFKLSLVYEPRRIR